MLGRLAVLALVTMGTTGCLDAARINPSCQLDDPSTAVLDLTRPADRRHLRDDAQLAEALGIRLGDAYRGRKSVPERQELREACRDSLFSVIATRHRVPLAHVQAAPARRDLALDALLLLGPMAVVLYWSAREVAGRVHRRFDDDEWVEAAVSTVLLSFAVAGLWLAIGNAWSWIVEMVRLQDQHLSFRAARIPWGRHALALYTLAVPCYWLAGWRRWRTHVRDDDARYPRLRRDAPRAGTP